jgi:predicted nucleotidyltransferase component of viral defense system
MIDRLSLASWQKQHESLSPDAAHVEQDLVISRALVDLYKHPLIKAELAFRGGTALQKCFFAKASRCGEDLDFVQIRPAPIGPILNAVRDALDSWLDRPKVKIAHGRATLFYTFESYDKNLVRFKIEINTREHYNFLALARRKFVVNSPWYSGSCEILTYQLEELLGTKLRALFQRKKGRDLFDLARALETLNVNVDQILYCFTKYLECEHLRISRAEFEANLFHKKNMQGFRRDMELLLPSSPTKLGFDHDFDVVMQNLIAKLPGERWKCVERPAPQPYL